MKGFPEFIIREFKEIENEILLDLDFIDEFLTTNDEEDKNEFD